jgi:hypothetical protein
LDLPDEQKFTVLGQGPEAVVDDEFKLVNLVANNVEHRGDGVVVGDGFLVLVCYLVGDFASLDKLYYFRKRVESNICSHFVCKVDCK